jgi:hypothetical protein
MAHEVVMTTSRLCMLRLLLIFGVWQAAVQRNGSFGDMHSVLLVPNIETMRQPPAAIRSCRLARFCGVRACCPPEGSRLQGANVDGRQPIRASATYPLPMGM